MTFRTLPDFTNLGVGKSSKCFGCNVHKTGRRERYPVIQIERRIHMEGFIQLCGQCIEQYADACGISVNHDAVAQRAASEYETDAMELQERLDEAVAELATYKQVIRDALDEPAGDE